MRLLKVAVMFAALLFTGQVLRPAEAQAAPGVTTLSCTPPSADPEIAALARALNYDYKLIYEYIYYNVDFSPTFGSKKGALGTYLDRTGNNFDQNVLFVALLRQSCVTANFRYGVVGYPAASVANWFGLQNDASVLYNVLGDGGIPACILLSGACYTSGATSGAPTSVNLSVVWTEFTVNGTTYELDPSYKSLTEYTPINMATATGYSQSDFLSSALSGSSSLSGLPSGTNSIKNVSEANIALKLDSYSQNLANYIQTNNASETTQQIFGGHTITNTNYGATYPTGGTLYTTLPSSFETVYTVSVSDPGGANTISVTLYGSQITARRLTLTYNGSSQPVLAQEGIVLGTGASTSQASQTVTLTVSNPYAAGAPYNTTTVSPTVAVGGSYAIMLAAGEVGRDTLTRHQNLIAQYIQSGQSTTSEPVTGESLAAIGATYLSQSARASQLLSWLGNTVIEVHESMGVAGIKNAPYVDFPGQLDSITGRATSVPAANVYGQLLALGVYQSSLESTSVTQMQANPAISTVRMFHYANSDGTAIVQANAGNWTALQGSLTGWAASDISKISAFLAANSAGQIFLPLKGSRTVGTWTGSGYFEVAQTSSTSQTAAYLISGGYKGANAVNFQTSPNAFDTFTLSFTNFNTNLSAPSPKSNEPINLYSGGYTYDHDDISVGSAAFPFGLTLTRSYDSVNYATQTALGWGWRHNFMISAVLDSDSYNSFGDANPLAAVQTAVNAYVSADLLATSASAPPIGNMVSASLSANWLMDQLVNNSVKVTLPHSVKKFTRIPTASGGSTYVPPPGDASTLTVNANGTPSAITDKNGVVMNFDAAGNISSWVDPNGNTVTFNYSGSGSSETLSSVSNGMGRTLTFFYTGGQLTTVSDNTGRSVSYAPDGSSNLASYTDANSKTTRYTYQSQGLLSQIYYPNYPSTAFMTNTYDAFGRVQTQADAYGNVWYYLFANGTRSAEIDPYGDTHVLYFDKNGNQTNDITPTGDTTSMTYDGAGRLLTITYPQGDSADFTYDAKNNVRSKTTYPIPGSIDPLTNLTPVPLMQSWTYDPVWNKVHTATDANLNVTYYNYDPGTGNLLSIMQPAVTKPGVSGSASPVTWFSYYPNGLVKNTTDAENRLTTFGYDMTGATATYNLLSVTRDSGTGHLNLTTSYTYDAVGNRQTVTDPKLNTTTTKYDLMRRVVEVDGPPATTAVTKTIRDAMGNPAQVMQCSAQCATTTPTWLTTYTSYDARDLVTLVTAPDNTWVKTDYDLAQRVSTKTSSSGRQVAYAYDASSRLKQITDQVSGTLDPSITVNLGPVTRETRTYYNGGLPATLADGKGNMLTYYHDGFERPAEIVYPDNSYDLHAFDANGNERAFQRRDSSQIWSTYDALNRRLTKAPTSEATISYGYDLTGRLLTAQASTDSAAYQFGYDGAGRLVSETSPLFGRTIATLDANGNIKALTGPATSAYSAAFSYDTLNRLTEVDDTKLRVAGFSYDPLSRRSAASFGSKTAVVASSAYHYTPAGQVAKLTHNWSGSALTLSYGYNNDHQRSGLTASDASFLPSNQSVATQGYAANTLNEYTGAGSVTPSYDGRGDLTFDGTWTYGYDTENRLISASSRGTSIAYDYDALGRRDWKKVTVGGVTTSTAWLSFGQRELAEYTGAGSTVSFARRFLYGSGVDEVLASIDGSLNRSYYFADAQGSVIGLTDNSGLLTERYAYGAYGPAQVTSSAPGGTAAYRYTGRRYEPETGIYYYRGRDYSPTLGRFLQTDPIGTDGGINLYAYVGNDPVNLVDEFGRSADVAMNGGAASPGNSIVGGVAGGQPGQQRVQVACLEDACLVEGFAIATGIRTLAAAGAGIAAGAVFNEVTKPSDPQSPAIDPQDVIGKTPGEIDQLAKQNGLIPKGPDPMGGRGAYVDPVTGEQRILIHPEGAHSHVNNPYGQRLGPNGQVVAPESPDAHLPLGN